MRDKKFSSQFKRDLKKYAFDQSVILELNRILMLLIERKKLPAKYKDHLLSGDYAGYRECHVKPDVLLVYKTSVQVLYLSRIGSHSELF